MIERLKRNLRVQGYHFELDVEQNAILKISRELGVPKGEPRNPDLLRTISPQPKEIAKLNTLSSRFGTSAFPFHTDTAYWEMPAKYVLLYCLNPGSGDRPTLLVDSKMWRMTFAQRDNLHEAVWQTTNGRPFLCTLMTRRSDGFILRWDEACLRPISKSAGLGRKTIGSFLNQTNPMRIDWIEKALLIIDNHRLLHARGAARRNDTDRALLKMLIAR